MERRRYLLLLLIIVVLIFSVLAAQNAFLVIHNRGTIGQQHPETWEYETLAINFWGADVAQDGELVVAGGTDYDLRVWRSLDEGNSWQHVWTYPDGGEFIYGVFIDSQYNVYVSSYVGSGIYRSSNIRTANPQFTEIGDLPSYAFTSWGMIEVDGVLYVGIYSGGAYVYPHIYKSEDFGSSWTLLHSFGSSGHIHCLRYSQTTGKMWAWVGDYLGQQDGFGLYYSNDRGSSWTRTDITETSLGSGWNMMSFELYGNYMFLTRHWDQGQLYRIDVSNIESNPSPPAVEVYQGGHNRLNWAKYYNGWILASGEGHSQNTPVAASNDTEGTPFDSGTWQILYDPGGTVSNGGCASVSPHTSLNGYLFMSDTINGQGVRLRLTGSS